MDERVIEQIKNVKLPDPAATHDIFEQEMKMLSKQYEDLRKLADLLEKID